MDKRVIPIFNNNITPIGAGGLDYILGRTCYDIKSGPNVMNKDQIEEARRKRESIIRMSKYEYLSEFVYINNFKVATAYGKLSSAKMFMREETGLIMFGRETWKELTGDEWNSFRLFLWQLRFVIENRVGNKWDRDSLNDAVLDFLKSFYDDYEDRQKYAVRMPEFIELQKLL